MSTFAIVFYAFMIGASCAAAYYHRRDAFMVLFSLTLASFLLGLLGGEVWLRYVASAIGVFFASAGLAYSFREFLVQILPREAAKVMRNAPLTASFGLFVIVVYVVAAVFAPVIAPYGEAEVIGGSYAPPDDRMLLGGDQLGRDMFSRVIYGARNTLGIALLTTAIAFLVGSLAGLTAATLGGWVDQTIGRVVDTMMAIPQIVFALLLLTILGTELVNLVFVLALLYSPFVFRLARAVAGNIVVMDYIEAARLRGEKAWYLIASEILPNAATLLVAEFGMRFCFVFLAISAFSFLGFGIQPPTADWGSMVRENAILISFGKMIPLIPAAAIAVLTAAVNFVVDWMLQLSTGVEE